MVYNFINAEISKNLAQNEAFNPSMFIFHFWLYGLKVK